MSSSLRNFKKVREGRYQFSCPICGDSSTNKKKARGYLLSKDNDYIYFCHNCLYSTSFYNFLKEYDDVLFQSYKHELFLSKNKRETYKIRKQEVVKVEEKNEEVEEIKFDDLIKVSELPKEHKARLYLKERMVPDESLSSLYWTDNFPELIESLFPGKYENIWLKEGIVFKLKSGGITGRTIENLPSKLRFFKAFPDINEFKNNYFCHCLNKESQRFVVEGVIDSLFFQNSIAILSSNLNSFDFPDSIYFLDQERRSPYIGRSVSKCIESGKKVVLLPQEYENMDINDIVKREKFSYQELENFLLKYTYSKLKAKVKFAEWKKF